MTVLRTAFRKLERIEERWNVILSVLANHWEASKDDYSSKVTFNSEKKTILS